MADPGEILRDLADESRELDDLVGGADWSVPTPAEGWTIAHQIAHLTWTDTKALRAVRDPDAFQAEVRRAVGAADVVVEQGTSELLAVPRDELLARWRAGRDDLAAALVAVPRGRKIPWYGPPMSAASMATARLMETWAHGQDVRDALGLRPEPTRRLRHIARIGARTRDFAYAVHGRPAPAEEFRIELSGTDGEMWTFGPVDAVQRITGSALGFCLLVTQRRHPADTDVVAVGPDAREWLTIAQAFAGPPGSGRKAGQFA